MKTKEKDPQGSGGGNTTLPLRITASKRWTFTAYMQAPELIPLIESKGTYIFGEEICPSTGREHLQGYIEFHKKERPTECVKTTKIHWEKARGSREDNIKYCSKEGKVHTNSNWILEDEFMEYIHKPKDWQRKILKIISEPVDKRRMFWFWEKTGGVGKSTFAKHLVLKHEAICLSGKATDIKYAINTWTKSGKRVKTVVIDLPRQAQGYISYGGIEEVKNGFFFSNKYESEMCLYNKPHVIVFANFAPDESKLSVGRWIIEEISQIA